MNSLSNSLSKVASKGREYQETEKHFKEINTTVHNKGYYLERFFEMQLR